MGKQATRIVSKPRSKYGATRTEVDGIVFHSKREAARYAELKLMEKAGQIHGLRCQFPYELSVPRIYAAGVEGLQPHRAPTVIGKYVADFIYYGKDGFVVEDVKGMATLPLAKWKMKHAAAQYGITITEVR